MKFIAHLAPHSFLHKMGRARNKAIISFGGAHFRWDGGRHLYSTEFLDDLPAGLVNHPAVLVAAMGNPPDIILSEAEMFKPESEPEPAPKPEPKKKLTPPTPGRPKLESTPGQSASQSPATEG